MTNSWRKKFLERYGEANHLLDYGIYWTESWVVSSKTSRIANQIANRIVSRPLLRVNNCLMSHSKKDLLGTLEPSVNDGQLPRSASPPAL